MRRLVPAVLAAAALAAPATADAQLSALRACDDVPGFRCATLRVPLDRTGATPGTLRLRVAVQRGYERGRRLTVALSGGPGQPAVPFAPTFAQTLSPLVRAGERLVVVDQRGTGEGALRCPGLQRLRALGVYRPAAVAACLRGLGPRRRHFATADSVDDLEALRTALGAPRLGLFGISYGTHVALQYARTYPARTRQLVLDSVLGPAGWDGFFLDTLGALPRVLQETTGSAEPAAALAAVAPRAEREGLRGRVADTRGRPRTVRRRLGEELLWALLAGDLNPALGAMLPAALVSAAAGDDAPLLRLLPIADGRRSASDELSAGLLVATDCADARLPYALGSPRAGRGAAIEAALDAVDPARHAPFSRAVLRAASLADDCSRWPGAAPRAPATGPLPDVPALLLGGRLDLRTPVENAIATAAQLPRATVVDVPGVGHDVLDSDPGGCSTTAVARFARGREVGRPCARQTDRFATPTDPVPAGLDDVAPAPGVTGARGRVVAAVQRTVHDVGSVVLARLLGGLDLDGGCLRGGRMRATAAGQRVSGCEVVPGVRVDGGIDVLDDRWSLRVRAPGVAGTLRGDGRSVRGTLGGRAVRVTGSSGAAAASSALGLRAARAWPRTQGR